jgi:mannose-6-phosphate isomerase-like protein (cupin superfamily)
MLERRASEGFSLATHAVHLAPDLGMQPCAVDAGFWADRERAELATGRLVSVFSYDAAWDYQELHPTGDELVYVLEGEVDLLLDRGDGERAQRLVRGGAGIVPAGSWHRLAVPTRATLLFVTPVPALTEHRARRAG